MIDNDIPSVQEEAAILCGDERRIVPLGRRGTGSSGHSKDATEKLPQPEEGGQHGWTRGRYSKGLDYISRSACCRAVNAAMTPVDRVTACMYGMPGVPGTHLVQCVVGNQ